MSYTLVYTDTFSKQIKKLDKSLQDRVLKSLERCQIRPYSHVKKLVGNDYYRLRVGDYRIILDIQDNKLMILVLELGHRKNIYK